MLLSQSWHILMYSLFYLCVFFYVSYRTAGNTTQIQEICFLFQTRERVETDKLTSDKGRGNFSEIWKSEYLTTGIKENETHQCCSHRWQYCTCHYYQPVKSFNKNLLQVLRQLYSTQNNHCRKEYLWVDEVLKIKVFNCWDSPKISNHLKLKPQQNVFND